MRKPTHNAAIDMDFITGACLMFSVIMFLLSIVFYNTMTLIFPVTTTRSSISNQEFFEILDNSTAFLNDIKIVGIKGYAEFEYDEESNLVNTIDLTEEEVVEEQVAEETAVVEEVEESEPAVEAVAYTEPETVSADTFSDVPYTEYTIKNGDSLYQIAIEYYGDGSAYPFIEKCNNLYGSNRNLIPGNVLRLYPLDYNISETEIKENGIAKEQSLRSKYLDIPTNVDYNALAYYGQLNVTGYDPYCAHCCGKANGITASGEQITEFYKTVACNALPFGTEIYVEGYGYFKVNDTGGSKVGIDIACESHEACATMSKAGVDVYIVN